MGKLEEEGNFYLFIYLDWIGCANLLQKLTSQQYLKEKVIISIDVKN